MYEYVYMTVKYRIEVTLQKHSPANEGQGEAMRHQRSLCSRWKKRPRIHDEKKTIKTKKLLNVALEINTPTISLKLFSTESQHVISSHEHRCEYLNIQRCLTKVNTSFTEQKSRRLVESVNSRRDDAFYWS